MLLKELIRGQEVTRTMDEMKEKQCARIREKARKSVMKKLQREARKSMRTGRGDGSISVSLEEMRKCDASYFYFPEEESFEKLLKTRGWMVNYQKVTRDSYSCIYVTIQPMRN